MTSLRLTAALALLLIAGPVCADNVYPITITNSGSTNTGSYKIDVTPDGSATYDNGSDTRQDSLPLDLAQKLFADVRDALPFGQMGPPRCAKSVSFGTSTTVTYNGERSPDISCGSDPKSAAIYQDVQDVQKAMGIVSVPRRRMIPVRPVPDQSNTSPG